MEIDDYQKEAMRTIPAKESDRQNIINFSFGIMGESGELIDLLKKHLFHDHAMNREELEYELGDILWYVSGVATLFGLSMDVIAEKNIAKLKNRYPEGFKAEDSQGRDK